MEIRLTEESEDDLAYWKKTNNQKFYRDSRIICFDGTDQHRVSGIQSF